MSVPKMARVFVEAVDDTWESGVRPGSVPVGLKRERTADLYHVSPVYGDEPLDEAPTFTPRVPENVATAPGESSEPGYLDNGFSSLEDSTNPRVSFASTLEGALASVGHQPNYAYAVYMPVGPIEVIYPSAKPLPQFSDQPDPSMWYTHDAEEHGEVWALQPVKLKLVQVIPSDQGA
jgi:hypothetical protein